jgi:hypothetical protein
MIELPLSTGDVALIDDVDAELAQLHWWLNSRGYVTAKTRSPYRRRLIRLHRAVMERATGRRLPSSVDVDHIDGNKLNCTRDNLRPATRQQNQANRDASRGRPYKGVYRSQTPGPRWVAKITVDGEQKYLGSFSTPEAAARAYNRACLKHFGEYARLNQIGGQP